MKFSLKVIQNPTKTKNMKKIREIKSGQIYFGFFKFTNWLRMVKIFLFDSLLTQQIEAIH